MRLRCGFRQSYFTILSALIVASSGIIAGRQQRQGADDSDRNLCQDGFFRCGNTTECLAQRYWCDGHQDCLSGDDESFSTCSLPYYPSSCTCLYNDRLNCQTLGLTELPKPLSDNVTIAMFQQNKIKLQTGMFRDMNTSQLRYLYLAENDIYDIPNGTFEGLSNLYNLDLADNRIREIHPGMFYGLKNLKWLNLCGNLIENIIKDSWLDIPELFWLRLDFNRLSLDAATELEVPPNLYWLHLEGNFISSLGGELFQKTTSLRDLLLRNNLIENISSEAFSHLPNLLSLDLSFNKIKRLPHDVFSHNTELDDLSIGNNPISVLPLDIFHGLNNISRLNLEGLTIENIDQSMFENLRCLSSIKFSTFHYCRYAKYVRDCSPKGDGLSNFYDLLASPVLRGLIWIVAVVTVSGNIAVLISRFIIREQHRAHSMFLRNLSASDLLMGIYLFIIAAQDVRMRNIFNREALDWSSSAGCQMTGILAMVSCEVSVLLLTFMTAERFLAVVYPLRRSRLSFGKSLTWVVVAWVVGTGLSICPVFLGHSLGNFYGSNGVCFPLHIQDPYRPGWQYSALLFLGVNFVAFITIAVLYVTMLRNIFQTRQQASGHTSRLDLVVVRRFTLIVLSDALCWIPIAVIKICALCHVIMSENVHSWLTVLIVPINSALNPMIYTLSTPSFFVKLKQSFKTHSHGSRTSQSGSYRIARELSTPQPLNLWITRSRRSERSSLDPKPEDCIAVIDPVV